MTMRRLAVCLAAGMTAACGHGAPEPGSTAGGPCATVTQDTVDTCLRMNQVQVLGTHNSYHIAPEPALLAVLGDRGTNADYTHRPLTEQLSTLGIRQLEIDVYADPEGGRFANPAARGMAAGLQPPGPVMRQPGFKVLHVQDVDYRTTCATLKTCLTGIRDWSRSHPRHVPILVLIEAKDGVPEDAPGISFVRPLVIGARELQALDDEIRAVFQEDHLMRPDDVRGRHPTLQEAIRSKGWPALGAARGKVLFALDNTGAHRDRYLQGHPTLEGRVMFVSSPPGEPSAAFLKMNEAIGEEGARIRALVEEGYLIRTRADTPTLDARTGDTTRRDHAFRTGAHHVSTDYPEVSPFGSGYIARLPGAERLPARCNPVNAPAGCRDEWLEPR